MAIIAEDGTGLSNAQCYCDYDYYQSVVSELGLAHTHSEAQTEYALVSAAKRWIDGQHEFAGSKLNHDQALKFPRDKFGLPDDIKRANALGAWYHLQGLLLVDVSAIGVAGEVESESKAVGSLSKSVSYRAGTAQRYSRVLPSDLTNLLKPYLANSGMGVTYRL